MRVLRRDASRPIETTHRLMDLGVDSLMAMEVRNSLTKGLQLDTKLPATLVFDHPTVEAIARYLLDEVLDLEGAAATIAVPAVVAADRADTDPATLDGLNDDEVAELLEKKLEEL
jgi:acyl carrier protein